MRSSLVLISLLISFSVLAEIKQVQGYSGSSTFHQFTHDEFTNTGSYTDSRRSEQNWLGAQLIQLHIDSKMDVWLTNYVSSWYEPVLSLDGNIYNMSSQMYGANEVNGSRSWTGNGQTTEVTFSDGGSHEISETAYLLGEFEGGEDVYIWLTTIPEDGGEAVSADQWVQDADNDTSLVSRLDGTKDIAGNTRIDFGIDSASHGLIAREWVAFGVYDEERDGMAVVPGGPLPGAATAGALAVMTVLGASKLRKRKNCEPSR